MSAGEQHRAETGQILLLLLENWARMEKASSREPKGPYKQTQSMIDVSFQIIKNENKKEIEKKVGGKRERKEDIYEEL